MLEEAPRKSKHGRPWHNACARLKSLCASAKRLCPERLIIPVSFGGRSLSRAAAAPSLEPAHPAADCSRAGHGTTQSTRAPTRAPSPEPRHAHATALEHAGLLLAAPRVQPAVRGPRQTAGARGKR